MNLPTPPTDNLYKFLAVSGLLLVIAGLYLPVTWHDRVTETAQAYFDRTQDNLRELSATQSKNMKNLLVNAIETDRKLLENAARPDRTFIHWLGTSVLVVGTLIGAVGFLCRYRLYQKYQDLKVRRETQDVSDETLPEGVAH